MPKLPPISRRDSDTEHLEKLPVDASRPIAWTTLETIQRGLGRISYPQFKRVINATINCGEDYAAAKWGEFHGDRLNYCLSRHPKEQGFALINLAYRLDDLGRAPERTDP